MDNRIALAHPAVAGKVLRGVHASVADVPSGVVDRLDSLSSQSLLERLGGLDAPSGVLTECFLIGVEYGRRLEADRGRGVSGARHAGGAA